MEFLARTTEQGNEIRSPEKCLDVLDKRCGSLNDELSTVKERMNNLELYCRRNTIKTILEQGELNGKTEHAMDIGDA